MLNEPYWGYTNAYTLLNATAGVKLGGGQGDAQPARHEPAEPEGPAAHLRRPDAALGDGRGAVPGPSERHGQDDPRPAGRRHRHRLQLGARDRLRAWSPADSCTSWRAAASRCASRAGSTRAGRIQREALDRTCEALRDFRSIAQRLRGTPHGRGRHVRAPGRGERPAFIRRVRSELKLEIRILSGLEEARYGFLGAVTGLPVDDGVAFDLGGGSLQLATFRGGRWSRP